MGKFNNINIDNNMSKHSVFLNKFIWLFIAINGAVFVGLSAYASHAPELNNSPYLLSVYQKASLQHILHLVVLLILAVGQFIVVSRWLIVSMTFFITGIILFSYTLYLFSFTGVKIAAFLTPIGGVCFILGWLSLAGLAWHVKRSGEHINE